MNDDRRHTIATDDVSVLSKLIDHAHLSIAMRPIPEQGLLDANLDLVRRAHARPSGGNRAICDHTLMFAEAVKLCDKAMHTHNRREAEIFTRVIGALFPDIRGDLSRALDNRTRPTP